MDKIIITNIINLLYLFRASLNELSGQIQLKNRHWYMICLKSYKKHLGEEIDKDAKRIGSNIV